MLGLLGLVPPSVPPEPGGLLGDVGDVGNGGGVMPPPDPGVLRLLGSLGVGLVVPPGLLGSLGSPPDPDDPPCGWPRLGHLPPGLPVFSSSMLLGRSPPEMPVVPPEP